MLKMIIMVSCIEVKIFTIPSWWVFPLKPLQVTGLYSLTRDICLGHMTRFVQWYVIRNDAMAPHSSTLAWKIPWMEEPGRLLSMGSLRVRHNWVTSLSLFTFMHWRRKWQPTPVFLPGESQGRGSLVGCCLWDHTESDTTEATQQQQQQATSRKKL